MSFLCTGLNLTSTLEKKIANGIPFYNYDLNYVGSVRDKDNNHLCTATGYAGLTYVTTADCIYAYKFLPDYDNLTVVINDVTLGVVDVNTHYSYDTCLNSICYYNIGVLTVSFFYKF